MNMKMMTDYDILYNESEEGKTMTRFEFGMYELTKTIRSRKCGAITKSEYNQTRSAIEKQLLGL